MARPGLFYHEGSDCLEQWRENGNQLKLEAGTSLPQMHNVFRAGTDFKDDFVCYTDTTAHQRLEPKGNYQHSKAHKATMHNQFPP